MAILSFRKKREKNTSQYPHRSPNFAFYEINQNILKIYEKNVSSNNSMQTSK